MTKFVIFVYRFGNSIVITYCLQLLSGLTVIFVSDVQAIFIKERGEYVHRKKNKIQIIINLNKNEIPMQTLALSSHNQQAFTLVLFFKLMQSSLLVQLCFILIQILRYTILENKFLIYYPVQKKQCTLTVRFPLSFSSKSFMFVTWCLQCVKIKK